MASPWATLSRGRDRGTDAGGRTQPVLGRGVPVWAIGLALFASVGLCAVVAPSAQASRTPIWHVRSTAEPTIFRSTDGPNNDEFVVSVENIGTAPSSGEVIVTDRLPEGIVTSAGPTSDGDWTCTAGSGQTTVTCKTFAVGEPATGSYHRSTLFYPGQILVPVSVTSGPPRTLTNKVTVSGGGAPGTATASTTNAVNAPASPAFGIADSTTSVVSQNGTVDTTAGGHPYALTTDIGFNQELIPGASNAAGEVDLNQYADGIQGDEARTVVAELPLGLIGNPQAAPQCPVSDLGGGDNASGCPSATQVGVAYIDRGGIIGPYAMFNLVPEPGHAAEFGLTLVTFQIVLYGSVVHTPAGYTLRVTAPTPMGNVRGLSLTFFGDPAAVFATGEGETPFVTDSFDCAAGERERAMTLHADSWAHPGLGDPFDPAFSDPDWSESTDVLAPWTSCGTPQFDPSFDVAQSVTADGGTSQADEPSGYDADLKVPQTELASELATPELKDATITLPEGLGVSPSAAGGLEACSNEQIDLASSEVASCPLASQIGTVTVTTPLLAHPLEGQVFLGEPECSPCGDADATSGRLYRLFIQIHSDQYGVTIKLPGTVTADPATGRLTASFKENPQLPFSELQLVVKSGPRAPLVNPQSCGTFTTTSDLSPWGSPEVPDAVGESSFKIDSDGKGGTCPAVVPFSPAFTAGTASPTASSYSPFAVTLKREDGEQDLSGVTLRLPPGLLGRVAGVEQCAEAQANAGTCASASQIGTATVATGAGEDPLALSGKVFLTGPYNNAPFGLSVAVPAVAGPFNLGVVVVRATIQVDMRTGALTVSSNPLPQYVDGVQLRLRTINIEVNRPSLTFNATSCAQQQITATITASQGATTSASSPYGASGCSGLPFSPSFAASTQGAASFSGNGASLDVNVSQSAGEANIANVDVQLPKALPSRLTTLKQACTEAQFNSNPAACPEGSDVGTAVAHTPVLNNALVGPAYLVSHGGASFPDLEVVLQGEGVTLILDGRTEINNEVTFSRFDSVPDAPISSFDLNLPEGPHSALASPAGSLCGTSLVMGTTITGHNGKQVTQHTKLTVTGCAATKPKAKARPLTRAQKLTKALKACKKDKRKRRAACERQAHKKYPRVGRAKTTTRRTK